MIYAAIVFLPLAGALIAGFFGRVIGARPSEIITTSFLMLAAVLSWIVFFQVALGHETHEVTLFRWITSGELDISWSLKIDTLTAVMLIVVTTVSSLVHLYSIGYMHDDDSRPRFFAYLSLFTFAMLMLVTSGNLVQMFFGWEGVGLASYLLIGFWYTKPSACAAAIKAFVVNRVGDFGFALGIFALFFVFHTVNLDTLFTAVPGAAGKTFNFAGHDVDILTTISLLLFMGAMGKSAQFLLHTWLPDAMEGPTPVSALIHAATMVTAGVFMVARLSPIFEHAPDALAFVTLIGSITAFFAATVGLVQNDIKRVIAYSTCSQLGYMFVACGIGAYGAGIFHLFTHAFFKALLFLGAGSVIHAMHHEQDMRAMGGLRSKIPWTFAAMLIGTFALTGVGIPHLTGFAGFYSKDAIIEASYAAGTPSNYAFWALVIAAAMTSFYSWRLIFMTFYGKTRADHHTYDHAHESPPAMMIPLAVLSIGAAFAGIVFTSYFIGHDQKDFWGAAIYTGEHNHILHEMHEVPEWVSYSSFVAMIVGFAIAWVYYIWAPWLPAASARAFRPLYLFLLNKWYFDELYNFIFVKPAFALGRLLWKGGDGAIIDGAIDGTAEGVVRITDRVVKLQTGYMYHYAFAMLIGVAAILTWLSYNGLFGGIFK
ncbi:MAG TPA: NADH-quinone oxidoreductase subunit L [Hyphomicrobium sp.]|nr:NADH-quinone oxidoreductase subunit L [Hyphomicrobium sp.]